MNNSNTTEDLLDELPILSANDKKKVVALIQQNSKLLKFCCDSIAQDFKDIDERSQRSLGVTLFINTAMTINKSL